MPPKASAKAVPASPKAATSGPRNSHGDIGVNKEYYAILGQAVSKVLNHPIFKSLRVDMPLPIGKGGIRRSSSSRSSTRP